MAFALQALPVMRTTTWLERLIGLLGALLLVGTVYASTRPWFHEWGSTPAERQRRLPGDEILRDSRSVGTHAITVHAPAEALWPWLAQTGQDRGGFHSYEVLEDLVGCEMENLSLLDPRLQTWKLGDKLWMYPPTKLGGVGHAVLMSYVPGRALGFGTRQIGTPLSQPVNGTWSFVIEPIDGRTSRLLIRSRASGQPGWLGRAFNVAVFEPAHFAMERKMMTVLKARAEGRQVSEGQANLEVALWFVTFGVLLSCAALVVAGRRWRQRLGAFVAAGLLLQYLTLGQPPTWISGPLVLMLVLVALAPRWISERTRELVRDWPKRWTAARRLQTHKP
jgi:hypothetical protein